MTQKAQAKCPGCGTRVRVPVDWIGRSVRCKQCGKTFKAGSRPLTPPPDAIVIRESPATAPPPVRNVPADPPPPEGDVLAAPSPAGSDNPFAEFADEPGWVVARYQRRRRRGPGGPLLLLTLGLFVLTLLGTALALAAFYNRDKLARLLGRSASASTQDAPAPPALPVPDRPPADFPRRALGICVSDYWYANPVTYGDGELSFGALLRRLANVLHIPTDQVAELSDAGSKPRLPLKSVIQGTVERFLDSSRAQDRVLLLFAGHAVTIGGQAYLAPIEGDLAEKGSLIPLSWLYERLGACKARQKVLIIDVCRHDPSRGSERPEGGPMSKELDALLRQPPSGVQVWSACSAGEYSYEASSYGSGGDGPRRSIFLSELWETIGPFQKRIDLGSAAPEDPLPLAPLAQGRGNAPGVIRATTAEAADIYGAKQTPHLSGDEKAGGAPFDAQAPLPPPPTIAPPTVADGPAAPGGLIQSILEETGAKAGVPRSPLANFALLPPFPLQRMAAYADDKAPASLRDAISRVNHVLEKHGQALHEDFVGRDDSAQVKKAILEKQHEPARILAELNDARDELEAAAKELPHAAARWQPTYAYVKARLDCRIAQLHEYDYMLGQIRMQALPKRDPLKHAGWRLAPEEKLHASSGSKVFAKEARENLKTLAAKYPGTPWEVLARRLAVTALGLEWQLIPNN